MDSKQRTTDTYNRSASALSKRFNELTRAHHLERTFSFTKVKNPAVFEIGCGNGKDAAEILSYTNNYRGIDISPGMIALARERVPSAEFEVADVEECEFPQNLDVVFAFASLLHSNKEAAGGVFTKVYNALNPGGLFFISLKNAPYHAEDQADDYGTRTFYYYTKQDIDVLESKFKILWYDDPMIGKTHWLDILLQK